MFLFRLEEEKITFIVHDYFFLLLMNNHFSNWAVCLNLERLLVCFNNHINYSFMLIFLETRHVATVEEQTS